MKKQARRIVTGMAALVVLLMLSCLGGGFYLLDYALCPTAEGKGYRAPALEQSWQYMAETYPHVGLWIDSLHHAEALRDTFITATDGTRLHALYAAAPQPTKRTAVIVHGYTDNAIRMLMIGYLYHHDLRCNILLPDLRHAGLSEGSHIQMGWNDRLDVLRWISVADCIFGGETHTVVHGISMGAATTMMASGEQVPGCVKCFVEDCGYTDVWAQFSKELNEQFHLPDFPLLHTASLLCKLRYGWSFREASALQQVQKCRLPMLFIHGDADDYVPTRMVYPLYEAKPEPKELWVVPGASHAVSYRDNREEYTRRVKAFTDRYL